MPTLADVFQRHGRAYLARFGTSIPLRHREAIADVLACRTGKLGGHLARCAHCDTEHLLFHSCCNRACPRCGSAASARWIDTQRGLLLPAPYFHVVFTLPQQLRRIVRGHQRTLLAALCRAAFDALARLCADPRFLGARIGALAVIHTWSRTLVWHPHVHMLVPGGGLDPDNNTWTTVRRPGRKDFLVPVSAVADRFRARFMTIARRALPDVAFPQSVWSKRWIVWVKRSVPRSSERLLGYLGRYVHRTALTDKRIIACDEDSVTFTYRDCETGAHRSMTLTAQELIRRFLQHVVPKGMHRVRAYGLLHPCHRHRLRTVQLALQTPTGDDEPEPPAKRPALRCWRCGNPSLLLLVRLSRQQCEAAAAHARAPPHRVPTRSPPVHHHGSIGR